MVRVGLVGRRFTLPLLAALEHIQHPVGDDDPADDVERGEEHRNKSEHHL